MTCPHCCSRQTDRLSDRTNLGYAQFRCRHCRRKYNERTGTRFNYLEFPTDIVFQVVLCRLRYKLSLRDLAELFLLRGFRFTYETVRAWEERFAPLLAEQLRRKRKGQSGRQWFVDETYVKVRGKSCYLYRAIDQDGNLVDSPQPPPRTRPPSREATLLPDVGLQRLLFGPALLASFRGSQTVLAAPAEAERTHLSSTTQTAVPHPSASTISNVSGWLSSAGDAHKHAHLLFLVPTLNPDSFELVCTKLVRNRICNRCG